MKKIFTVIQVLAFIGFAGNIANGQIQINDDVTPEEMVDFIVGDGIIYDNVTFSGAAVSRGIFGNGQTTNLGLDDGIFLTSGAGYIIPGPNNSSGAGVNNQMPGDPNLNSLTTSVTYDASVLEFNVIPGCDTIRITYVFGTEEDNWVGSSFNDIFGFFVTGPNPAGGQYSNYNLACNPQTAEYIENTEQTLQYDQFTIVITAKLPVIGAEEYHIKLAIADCGDGIYDSGVFIKENSIYSDTHIDITTVLSPPGLTNNMVEGHVAADIIFHLQNTDYTPVTVYYSVEGDAMNGYDYEEIDDEIYFPEGQDSAILHLTAYQDGLIEGDETIRLIIFNTLGGVLVIDTVEVIIQDYLEMYSTISPNTLICEGCEVTLWVDVIHGYPPYSYSWEPGGFTMDSITVTPDTTTTYVVTYHDLFQESGMDSVKVFVLPVTAFSSFGFEAALNPGLPFDVTGEFSGDTILCHLPGETNLQNLVASYTFDGEYIYVTANGVPQESSVTPNDFTNPVIYIITGPGMVTSEWVVIADIETAISKNIAKGYFIYPNPSTGKFYLKIENSSAETIEIMLMDLTGRSVYEEIAKMTGRTEIDLSDQPKGMYILQIKSGSLNLKRKLIIE